MLSYLSQETFWTYVVVLPLISVIGLLGNIVNLVVLQRGDEFQVKQTFLTLEEEGSGSVLRLQQFVDTVTENSCQVK